MKVPACFPELEIDLGTARAARSCALWLAAAISFSAGVLPATGQGTPVTPAQVPTQQSLPAARTTPDAAQQQDARRTNPNVDETTDATRRARVDDRRADDLQEVPTEFQRLVAASTGQQLPIFGASLFNDPQTFAPSENIPTSPDYLIGPGDELRVQVYGQVNQQYRFVVDRTGDISYPEVGTIHVAGVRYGDLEGYLTRQLSRDFRNFQLNVNLGQLRTIQIFVVGEGSRRPGTYDISSFSTLLNALFVSGGARAQGDLRDIQVIRGKQTIIHFDLYDLLLRGDKSKDISLATGDVIFIPTAQTQVAVSGSVNNPAIYEIKPGDTVKGLIALAGGDTSVALGTRVRIERIYEHTMRNIVDVDLAVSDPVLENGDIVTVGTILDRYKDAVTLRGNVAFPGRYVWHPGMRILDLVPTKEQLITREYYRRRNQLGNTAADYVPPTNPVGSLQLRGNPAAEQADEAVQSGGASASSKGGNSIGSALIASNGVFAASTDVVLSAPDLDWDYAVIERLDQATLTTSLIPFNPGRLYKDGDLSQNLALLPSDVITFFSTADVKTPTVRQTRYVRLEGEFNAAGVYSVLPGETLRGLLVRAGGFTPDAYLYGSEFTRQSTRRVQQQRLNEFADNLESQLALLNASSNARAVSTQDTAAAAANAVQGNQVVARLRRLVPVGRIVLEVKPDSRGVDSLPDLPLEDGDRFVVPRVPSTVTVEGQVYSANAYVFTRGRKERDYLRQAGGPDREADHKRTFILRADGSVFSKQYGDVDHAIIFPGDTIVIPPQLDRRAILRNLLDLSSIIGGFGLGAAAINVLR